MGKRTPIHYCDSTLSLLVGCDGCELSDGHCYAQTLIGRFAGKRGWPERFTSPQTFLDRLAPALRWSDLTGKDRPDKPWLNGRPRIVFLNDLSDTFTESVDVSTWIPVVSAIADSPHVWILLTKRPARLKALVDAWTWTRGKFPQNIWAGVSVTSQATAWRLAELLKIDGLAVRFVSAEPLLGPLSLVAVQHGDDLVDCLRGDVCSGAGTLSNDRHVIDWVIVGGESGRAARPLHPAWVRFLLGQCVDSGTPLFFKQWGQWELVREFQTWVKYRDNCPLYAKQGDKVVNLDATPVTYGGPEGKSYPLALMRPCSKGAAGRVLRGKIYSGMPGKPMVTEVPS